MDFTVEKLEKSQIKFNFVADRATFDDAVNTVYARSKHKYSVPGFRKGHVPKKVIEGMYGASIFYEDALNDLIDKAVGQLHDSGEYSIVEVSGVDNIDLTDEGGLKFSLTVLVKPEVKLGEYKNLSVEKRVASVTDEQVDDYIRKEQSKQARLVDIDAGAVDGNTVVFDFQGTVDGVPFEGGTATNHTLELGSHEFIPGFEEQLLGVKAGESRDINVTFPDDYSEKTLAGKPAVFHCTVHSVQTIELPEINDEFATTVSDFDTLDEYKADVKANLLKQDDQAAEREYENSLIEKIVQNAEVEVPDAMIKIEVDDMIHEFEHNLAHQGVTLDNYLKYINKTREDIEADFSETAKKNVPTRLVLEAILKAEDIKLENSEIDAKLEQFAHENGEDVEKLKQNMQPQFMEYIINSALSEKLVDTIKGFNQPHAATEKNDVDDAAQVKPAKKPRAKKPAAAKEAEETEVKAEAVEEAKPVKKSREKKAPAAEASTDAEVNSEVKAESSDAAPAKKKSTKKAKATESDAE